MVYKVMKCYLILFAVEVAAAFGEPFISPWQIIRSQTNGPYIVLHPLGQYPAKVEVQIQVTEGGRTIVFSGMGAAQRDDDSDTYYGGIVYTYNDKEVRLYVPLSTNTPAYSDKGGLVYTGGAAFIGPLDIYATTAKVRIRAWRPCDFPSPKFTSIGTARVSSTSGHSFREITHGLGVTPDYVIVQLKMDDGYISEAEGVLFQSRASDSYNTICGSTFAYNAHSIRVWTAKEGLGKGYVFCAYDGWGTDNYATSADLNIKAWIFDADFVKFSETQSLGVDIPEPASNFEVNLIGTFNLEDHIFLVQVKVSDPNNSGYVFHGSGTSMTDGSLGPFGGVIYGFTEREVLLWKPNTSSGYMAYMAGVWGGGAFTQASKTADVTVKVLKVKFNEASVPSSCPDPPEILNADKLVSTNRAMYSCRNGFSPNSGNNTIECSNAAWSNTTFQCYANAVDSGCPNPPDILNADKLVTDNTTLYSCYHGYTSTSGSRRITCSASVWSSTSYQCVLASIPSTCPEPPEIQNTEKVVSMNKTMYSCKQGLSPSSGNNIIECANSVWSNTSFKCHARRTTTLNISLQGWISVMRDDLRIDEKNTSKYRRSLICASDPRLSATYTGYLGIIILTGTIAALASADVITLWKTNVKDADL